MIRKIIETVCMFVHTLNKVCNIKLEVIFTFLIMKVVLVLNIWCRFHLETPVTSSF